MSSQARTFAIVIAALFVFAGCTKKGNEVSTLTPSGDSSTSGDLSAKKDDTKTSPFGTVNTTPPGPRTDSPSTLGNSQVPVNGTSPIALKDESSPATKHKARRHHGRKGHHHKRGHHRHASKKHKHHHRVA